MGRGRQNTDRDCVVGYHPDVLSLTDDSHPTVADLFQVAVMKDARFAQGGILANPGESQMLFTVSEASGRRN